MLGNSKKLNTKTTQGDWDHTLTAIPLTANTTPPQHSHLQLPAFATFRFLPTSAPAQQGNDLFLLNVHIVLNVL